MREKGYYNLCQVMREKFDFLQGLRSPVVQHLFWFTLASVSLHDPIVVKNINITMSYICIDGLIKA
jgi:hypothetical protein